MRVKRPDRSRSTKAVAIGADDFYGEASARRGCATAQRLPHRMGESANSDQVLVFEVGGRWCGLPIGEVRDVLPMCRLVETVGQPAALAGLLNLRGELTPVVRLEQLFGLPKSTFHLHTHILVPRSEPPLALAVERAHEIVQVEPGDELDAPAQSVFGNCLEAVFRTEGGREISLLRLERILLREEQSRIAEFTRVAAARMRQLTESSF